LHFLSLDRSDPKKFQILQLIAALLGWDDEQKAQAGLTRPGMTSTGSAGASGAASSSSSKLRVPLAAQFMRAASFSSIPDPSSGSSPLSATNPPASPSKETLAELWSEFLQREARERSPSYSSHTPVSTASDGRHAAGSVTDGSVDGGDGGGREQLNVAKTRMG